MIYVLLGVIVIQSIALSWSAQSKEDKEEVQEKLASLKGTQFLEPISDKEKLEQAKTIQDLLE